MPNFGERLRHRDWDALGDDSPDGNPPVVNLKTRRNPNEFEQKLIRNVPERHQARQKIQFIRVNYGIQIDVKDRQRRRSAFHNCSAAQLGLDR